MRAWHFLAKNGQLRDQRPSPDNGIVLRHRGPIQLCSRGLHASLEPYDALQHAPGPLLCLVECGGRVLHAHDKLVCSQRTILARMDATTLLRYFARMQALSVVHLWQAPAVVLDFLMTGDEAIRWRAHKAAEKSKNLSGAEALYGAAAARQASYSDAVSAARGTVVSAWYAACPSILVRGKPLTAPRLEFNSLVLECFEGVL